MDAPLSSVLSSTIGDFVGKTLTEDAARQLCTRLLVGCYPGPVDTRAVAPKTVGSFVLRPGDVSMELHALRQLHEQHWRETEGHRHNLEFNPDYARAIDLAMQGRYLLLVAQRADTDELVGNYGLYLARSMHTQTLMATEDTLFVRADCRRGRLGVEMIRYAEYVLRALGVRELNVTVKRVNNVGPMIERMGYLPVGTTYTKILNEEPTNVRA